MGTKLSAKGTVTPVLADQAALVEDVGGLGNIRLASLQAILDLLQVNLGNVTITGGSITGITDLAVADGGTGASTASGARTNLSAASLGANTFTGAQTLPADPTAALEATTKQYVDAKTAAVTRAGLVLASISAVVTALRTTGYTDPGDGGGALYRRVGVEPSHGFKVQSADSTWWEGVVEAESLNVKQLGATGDGVTDDQTALANAVAFANSNGHWLYWPDGTYVTSASIANFHDVRHHGPGIVKRGADTWHITPETTEENILYVDPAGDDANDGLTAAAPIATMAQLKAILQLKGFLAGQWTAQLAASSAYDFDVTFENLVSEKLIQIKGPALSQEAGQSMEFSLSSVSGTFQTSETITGGMSGATATVDALVTADTDSAQIGLTATWASGTFVVGETLTGGMSGATATADTFHLVPAAIVGDAVTQNAAGWRFTGVNVLVQDVKFRNFDSGASAFAVAVLDLGKMETVNVHVDTAANGINQISNCDLDVKAGVIQNCSGNGIRSLFSCRYSIGEQNAADFANSPVVRNNATGLLAQEGCTGHADHTLFLGNTFGTHVQVNSRANLSGSDFKRNTVAVRNNNGNVNIDSVEFNTGTAEANTENVRSQDSSVIAGQNSNNWRKLDRTTATQTVTGTTAETTVYTQQLKADQYTSVPGGIYWGKALRVRLIGTITGTAGTKNLRFRLGGTLLVGITVNAAFDGAFEFEGQIFLTGNAAQKSFVKFVGAVGVGGETEAAYDQSAVNTASVADIPLTATVQPTNSGDSVSIEIMEFEVEG